MAPGMPGKWVFGSYTVEQNPSEDTGWQGELRLAEIEIAGGGSIYQVDGVKSQRRTVRFRAVSQAQRDAIVGLYTQGSPFSLTDDLGQTRQALIARLQSRRRPANGTWDRWDLELELVGL